MSTFTNYISSFIGDATSEDIQKIHALDIVCSNATVRKVIIEKRKKDKEFLKDVILNDKNDSLKLFALELLEETEDTEFLKNFILSIMGNERSLFSNIPIKSNHDRELVSAAINLIKPNDPVLIELLENHIATPELFKKISESFAIDIIENNTDNKVNDRFKISLVVYCISTPEIKYQYVIDKDFIHFGTKCDIIESMGNFYIAKFLDVMKHYVETNYYHEYFILLKKLPYEDYSETVNDIIKYFIPINHFDKICESNLYSLFPKIANYPIFGIILSSFKIISHPQAVFSIINDGLMNVNDIDKLKTYYNIIKNIRYGTGIHKRKISNIRDFKPYLNMVKQRIKELS